MSSSLPEAVKPSLFKLLVLPALWLCVLPIVALPVARHGETLLDEQVLASVEKSIDADDTLTAEQRPQVKAFYRANPASSVCTSSDPKLQAYRAAVCGLGDDLWQFVQARRVAVVSLVLALAAMALAGGLGLLAFLNRRARYVAFIIGWRTLTLVSILEIAMQAALAVWLSFWGTALFLQLYSVKLIAIVAVCAVTAVAVAISGILKRVPPPADLEAELVHEADAPGLWVRLREFAKRLDTAPPAHLLAGIDDNFFVTESPLTVQGKTLTGRSLFVSLPLLRVLEASEADAVLAHELGHFKGGDTAAGAKLGPQLLKFDLYMHELAHGGVTLPAYYLLNLFRGIFELASRKESRQREFAADRVAANLTSPRALGRSLLKVAGYSRFRAQIEQSLFATDAQHAGALGIGQRVESGLAAFVTTETFKTDVTQAEVPHPFDTHPPLTERLASVGSGLKVDDATQVFEEKVASTWVEQMLTASAIEERLWGAYEQRFAQAHTRSLAYRYLPSTDEERALVERFFPPESFAMKNGDEGRITYDTLELPDQPPLKLADIFDARIKEGNFAHELNLSHRGTVQPISINLKTVSDRKAFTELFGLYWNRARAAQDFFTAKAAAPASNE